MVAGAVLAALVVLVGGLVSAGLVNSVGVSSGPSTPAPTLSAGAGTHVPATFLAQFNGWPVIAQVVAKQMGHLTPVERAALFADMNSISPVALQIVLAGAMPEPMWWTPSQSEAWSHQLQGLSPSFPWLALGGAVLTGCVIGGVLGVFGGPVGAGVGCLVGATAGFIGFFYGLSFAQGDASPTAAYWLGTMAQIASNQFNTTTASEQMILSALNSTVYALESEADSVAVNQIGNASFNVLLDLNQSFIPSQFSSLMASLDAQLSATFNYLHRFFTQNFCSGGIYSNTATTLEATNEGNGGSSTGACNDGLHMMAYNATFANVQTNTTGTDYLWLPKGGTIEVFGSSSSCIISEPLNGRFVNVTLSDASSIETYNATTTGIYGVGAGGSCLWATATGVNIPPNALGSYNAWYTTFIECGLRSGSVAKPCANPTQAGGQPSGSVLIVPSAAQVGVNDLGFTGANPSTLYPWYGTAGGGPWAYVGHQLAVLLQAAAKSASVYWGFLRSLGYTSASQIPSSCIIPFPAQALPASITSNTQNLNVTALEEIYVAWLNGLATFFDTPPSASNFCAGYGQGWGGLGGVGIGHPYVNTSGYIFLPTTTAVPFPQETFTTDGTNVGKTSTWGVNGSRNALLPAQFRTNASVSAPCWNQIPSAPAVLNSPFSKAYCQNAAKNATQFVLWPTTRSVLVPVGQVWEIPVTDPLTGFVVYNPLYLTLHGNASVNTSGNVPNGQPAGAALVITSCSVNGTAVAMCPIQLSTIQGYTGNTSGPSPIPFGVSACGQTTAIWVQVVEAYTSVTGGSALGCLVAEILAFITIVIVIAIVAAVVVRVGRRD